jgi:hypothetical protein
MNGCARIMWVTTATSPALTDNVRGMRPHSDLSKPFRIYAHGCVLPLSRRTRAQRGVSGGGANPERSERVGVRPT